MYFVLTLGSGYVPMSTYKLGGLGSFKAVWSDIQTDAFVRRFVVFLDFGKTHNGMFGTAYIKRDQNNLIYLFKKFVREEETAVIIF